MLNKRWVYKEIPSREAIAALSQSINVNTDLATLLIQREITSFDQAKSFFRPKLEELHNPFLMKDMERAVDRLIKAISRGEKILVYGDYDVDGTTSVALFYGYLKRFYNENLDYYIPDRYKEGYGISEAGIEYAEKNGFSLIVSLDCGIKAVNLIKKAKARGIDFIVCDHHTPDDDDLPEAFAVLDPKRQDCSYPFKELSGCGVGFKLLQAFSIKTGRDQKDLFINLDLLAVSIASDLVPITGENRILTFWGLKAINKNPRPGLQALIDIAGLKGDLRITNVVFGIAPRINAAGRIDHAKMAVELLLAQDYESGKEIADLVDENNTLRRDFDVSITEEALAMIESDGFANTKSTVLFKSDWHKGVIGIVASRCIEKYYRPTIILTESNKYATGSARSIAGFDLYSAISQCSDLLEQFGGHTQAAGLKLKVENIEEFRKRFEEVASDLLTEEELLPLLEIDWKIPLNVVNPRFFNIIKQMEPFGPGNAQPTFVSENVFDSGRGRLLKGKHLKLCIKQEDTGGIDAIGFNMPEYYERISAGERFDVCYCVEENTFRGNTTLQLMIKDIKFRNN